VEVALSASRLDGDLQLPAEERAASLLQSGEPSDS
jgi:hypothetical protein